MVRLAAAARNDDGTAPGDGPVRRDSAGVLGALRPTGSGRRTPGFVVLGYVALAVPWVLVSHSVLPGIDGPVLLVEGLAFVAVTSMALWRLLRRRDAALVRHERDLARVRLRIEAMTEDFGHGTLLVQRSRIAFASSSVAAMVGREAADLLGRDPFELLNPDDVEPARRTLQSISSGGQRQCTINARLRVPGGGERWMRGVVTDHSDNPSVRAVVVNVHDVDDLQRREHLISALLRGATAIAAAPTERAVCDAFLAACVDATGVRLGSVRLVRGELLVVVAAIADELQPRPWPLRCDGATLGAQVVRSGRPVFLERSEDRAGLPAGAVPDGVSSCAYIPMGTPNGSVGYLALASAEPQRYDAPTRDALLTFAQQAALAVERCRLEVAKADAIGALTEAARRAGAVRRVTGAFSRAVRVHDVLDAATQAIEDALQPQTVAAVGVDEHGENTVVQRGEVRIEDAAGRYAAYSGIARRVFQAGEARWYNDLRSIDADLDADLDGAVRERGPWRAGCALPLRFDGEVVGVLIVGFVRERSWRDAERRLLETIGTLCAEAIRRARMHDAAEQAADRHRTLSEQYEQLFRTHPQPMVVYDVETFAVLAVNAAMVHEFRYGSERELVGRSALDLLGDEEQRQRLRLRAGREAPPRGIVRVELQRMVRKDGSTFVASSTGHTAERFGGRPARVVCLVDQTARVQAEADRRRLEERMVTVAEEERRRVAEDLHDGPVQSLAVAAMWLASVRRQLERGEPPDQGRLRQAETGVIDTIDELRSTMMRLYPPALDELSLAEAIRDAIAESPMLAGLDVALEDNLSAALAGPVKAALYRLVVEALTNVRKHAGVCHTTVRLDEADDAVEVRVIDGGVGVAAEAQAWRKAAHLGLVSMRDRITVLGGDCSIERVSEAGGTVVRARVPLGAGAAAGAN